MKKLLRLSAVVLAWGAFTSLAQSPPDLLIDLSTDSKVRLSWPETPGNIVLEETDTLTLTAKDPIDFGGGDSNLYRYGQISVGVKSKHSTI